MSPNDQKLTGEAGMRLMSAHVRTLVKLFGFQQDVTFTAEEGVRGKFAKPVPDGAVYWRSVSDAYGLRLYSGLKDGVFHLKNVKSIAPVALVVPTWTPRQGRMREIGDPATRDRPMFFNYNESVFRNITAYAMLIRSAYNEGAAGFQKSIQKCSKCGAPTFTSISGKNAICADICWENGPRLKSPFDNVKARGLPPLQFGNDGNIVFVDEEFVQAARDQFKALFAECRTHQPESVVQFKARALSLYVAANKQEPDGPAAWVTAAKLAVADARPFGQEDVDLALDLLI